MILQSVRKNSCTLNPLSLISCRLLTCILMFLEMLAYSMREEDWVQLGARLSMCQERPEEQRLPRDCPDSLRAAVINTHVSVTT